MIGPVVAAIAGILFGLGLVVSGMTDSSKIIGFLDVTGASGGWDPSLALVMAGALVVHVPLVRLAGRRPLLANAFAVPGHSGIDRRLLIGAVVFGVGWGLAGYCPGPALVAAGSGSGGAIIFVAAMTIGLLVPLGSKQR